MRSAATISLLLLIGYTQWGYDLRFIVRQWQLKEAAREAWIASLPDKAFLRLSVDDINAGGKWEDGGRECWYRGHLYDVIRQRRCGGTTWCYCLDDTNEAKLIRQAGDLTKAGQDHPDKQTPHSLSFSIGDLACEAPSWVIQPPVQKITQHKHAGDPSLPIRYSEIVLPPPKG